MKCGWFTTIAAFKLIMLQLDNNHIISIHTYVHTSNIVYIYNTCIECRGKYVNDSMHVGMSPVKMYKLHCI